MKNEVRRVAEKRLNMLLGAKNCQGGRFGKRQSKELRWHLFYRQEEFPLVFVCALYSEYARQNLPFLGVYSSCPRHDSLCRYVASDRISRRSSLVDDRTRYAFIYCCTCLLTYVFFFPQVLASQELTFPGLFAARTWSVGSCTRARRETGSLIQHCTRQSSICKICTGFPAHHRISRRPLTFAFDIDRRCRPGRCHLAAEGAIT